MKPYTFVFVSNIMYVCQTIQRVRWYHRLFGFPGRVELARVTFEAEDDRQAFLMAKYELEEAGFREQIMGDYL